jgi:hypothetical protein
LIIGDLTNFGPASLVENMLGRIKDSGVPTFAIPGNCDPKQMLGVLDKYGVNLHAKRKKLNDVSFVGLGGSNLTPFNTPFELTEAEIQEELEPLAPTADEKWVLMTHAPPHGTKIDQTKQETHVGSKSIRKFIEEKQPLVALSGHVHEARDTDKLGRTLIVNPGPVSKGYAVEITINKGGEVQAELLEL